MIYKKTLAVIVAIAMVASTMIVLDTVDIKFVEKASAATPGYDEDYGWNSTGIINETDGSDEDITSRLVYGEEVFIEFNGTTIDENCWLFYPDYNVIEDTGSGYYEVFTNWSRYSGITITPSDLAFNVDLTRAGLWLVLPNSASKLWKVNMSDFYVYDATDDAWEAPKGWFWVNSSDDWSVELSDLTYNYDTNSSLSITVKDGEGSPIEEACYIDIWNVYDIDTTNSHRLVYHKYLPASANGEWIISGTDMYKRTHISGYGAGTYRVAAYAAYEGDTALSGTADINMIYGESGDHNFDTYRGWNNTFGSTDYWPGRFMDGTTLTQIRTWDADQVDTATWSDATYKWKTCGPFDPPEYWTDYKNFTVAPGEPTVTFNNGTEIFWKEAYSSKTNQINVTIKDYDDDGMQAGIFTIALWNKSNPPSKTTSTPIPTSQWDYDTSGSYLAIYPRYDALGNNRWGWNETYGTWADKGKVYVTIGWDSTGNASEEWNTTFTFRLTTAKKVFKWVDDGSTAPNSLTDGELEQIPDIDHVPLCIEFQIQNEDYYYFGDIPNSGDCATIKECAENITITGDSLFKGSLDKIPNYDNTWFDGTDTWTIPIIPLMNIGGGLITITAKAWNSTLIGKLAIGGTLYYQNGTVVTVTPNKFNIDEEDKTLDITVQTGAGVDVPGAYVKLYYINEDIWNCGAGILHDDGDEIDFITSGPTPTYSMGFNVTQQTENQTEAGLSEIRAPRNLTVYVRYYGYKWTYGYALLRIDPNNDLEIDLGRETMMAGYPYDDFSYDCSIFGTNDTPDADDEDDFQVSIYNSDGDDVTDTLFSDSGYTKANSFIEHYSREAEDFEDLYALEPGTYTFYCYNKTHDSRDHNATLVVDQVQVTCDKSPFIWKFDENISATFSVRYQDPDRGLITVNGSLILDNISNDPGDYNMTYMNTSFDGSADQGGNGSMEVDEDLIIEGDVTIHDITADYLPPDVAEMNITFWFRPIAFEDGDLGEYARASGRVPVQVPTVTPDPMYVAVGERTIVDILASGRGTPIDDIYIGLHGRGVEINGTTGSDGIATMSVIPTSAGNISIDVGEEGRTVDTVLIATNWVLHISLPAQVDERDDFEITITEKASGDPVMGATVELQGVGTVTTDENGIAAFTAPEVTSDRILEVTADADGYAPEPGAEAKSIVIINKPKIYISIPSEITLDEAVTIQAGADDGNNNGILVTITGPGGAFTGTTVNGVVKIKVTKEEGKYTITAEKPDYESADPITVTVKAPSPGFELLTLIIAIGVAYILLRRRRQH